MTFSEELTKSRFFLSPLFPFFGSFQSREPELKAVWCVVPGGLQHSASRSGWVFIGFLLETPRSPAIIAPSIPLQCQSPPTAALA